MNPARLSTGIADPSDAIISLVHDEETSYELYLQVYSQIERTYDFIWEEQAQSRYGRSFELLSIKERNSIIRSYPKKISEADPVTF